MGPTLGYQELLHSESVKATAWQGLYCTNNLRRQQEAAVQIKTKYTGNNQKAIKYYSSYQLHNQSPKVDELWGDSAPFTVSSTMRKMDWLLAFTLENAHLFERVTLCWETEHWKTCSPAARLVSNLSLTTQSPSLTKLPLIIQLLSNPSDSLWLHF